MKTDPRLLLSSSLRRKSTSKTWSVLESYRVLYEIFHSLSLHTVLRSWAVEVSSSYLGQRVISDYAPEECWILFLVSIALNFALKYWFGVTNILITSLKRLTALSLNELEWVQGKNLQFQAPSLCHYPNILCTILRCSSKLYATYFSKLQLNSVFYYLRTVVHWTCSGLHLDIVLSSYSKPSSLLFLRFYLLHLILASEGRVAEW